MQKVTNTTKIPNPEELLNNGPSSLKTLYIEAQEATGQKELVDSLQLPRTCNFPRDITNTAEQYHKMGIKVFTTSKDDALFLGVKLPKGWKKEETDHSMWSNLLDDKGRVRASFFYKAAFYDRDAFVNFEFRYIIKREFVSTNPEVKTYPKFYCVQDTATKEILFKTENTTEYHNEILETQCVDFLETNFPDYKNLNAYWD